MDDGSTDNSAEILKNYSSKDPRIKTFTKKNGGASSARNFALSKIDSSPSTWISFVDSDDYISPSMYADIVEALNDADDDTIDYIRLKPERTKLRHSEFLNLFLLRNVLTPEYLVEQDTSKMEISEE